MLASLTIHHDRLRRPGTRWRSLGVVVLSILTMLIALPAVEADGPPAPGPYPPIALEDSGPPEWICRDASGTQVWSGTGWTLEPLVRGPLFAPVVLWLPNAKNQPVLPLQFSTTGFPMWWETADGGTAASGNGGDVTGARPVGYGSTPTDPSPRVTCAYSQFGFYDFGTYLITPSLQTLMSGDADYGVPSSMVGRSLLFSNEASLTFSLPESQFPTTASVKAATLRTPVRDQYRRLPLPTTVCRDATTTRYSGAAWTLAPLTRGYGWSPMAFWLDGDRIVAPRWFSSVVTGTWQTVSGVPVLKGTLDATQEGRPSGVGPRPTNATSGVQCSWTGVHEDTRVVTRALATQLGLPTSVIGRSVELSGQTTVRSWTPTWMWPPAA